MEADPHCPVCGLHDWETVGARTYSLDDVPRLNDYQARRYRVLFEVWFPGRDAVELESKLCRGCGFVTYTPRPTAQDVEAKYRYRPGGGGAAKPSPESAGERARGEHILKYVRPYLKQQEATVLDFGGGDGRLMTPFLAHGCRCSVIDYCERPVPGVERLGDTLDVLAPDVRFDAVVCSHVVEHLAEPFGMLVHLRRHLAQSGVLYCEVPMEIWRAAPLQDEPVTHVNFFTVDSLRYLLERAGYAVPTCRMTGYHHPSGGRATVITALAILGRDRHGYPPRSAAANTRRLLQPDLRMFARMLWIRPDLLIRFVRRRVAWTKANSS